MTMLGMRAGPPRSATAWLAQVAAPLGATLMAAVIFNALPAAGPRASPQPELTSGGKFAARALLPAAYDGLDTMPLPHLAPGPVTALPVLVQGPGWEGPTALGEGASALPADRPTRNGKALRAVSAVSKVVARRVVTLDAASPDRAGPGRADGGAMPGLVPPIVPKTLSMAATAWSLMASAGGALLSHVVPQIP